MVAASVMESDEALRKRVKRLVNALLADAEYTIKYGSPQERNALMRMVIPPLLKSLQGADVNAGEAAQAEAYSRMLENLRGTASPES